MSNVFYYTDSIVTLSWIKSFDKKFKPLVEESEGSCPRNAKTFKD